MDPRESVPAWEVSLCHRFLNMGRMIRQCSMQTSPDKQMSLHYCFTCVLHFIIFFHFLKLGLHINGLSHCPGQVHSEIGPIYSNPHLAKFTLKINCFKNLLNNSSIKFNVKPQYCKTRNYRRRFICKIGELKNLPKLVITKWKKIEFTHFLPIISPD